jgi:hypothetical protein
MEHSLHLAVKHFVETISPCPSENCGAVSTGALAEDDKDDEDDNADIDAVDSLGKAIAFVKQVRFAGSLATRKY